MVRRSQSSSVSNIKIVRVRERSRSNFEKQSICEEHNMRPSKDSKRGGGGGGGISGHVSTLHQRLFHALNLGTSYYDGKELKWKCKDIEIQRHVVRSIAAFLDSISADTLQHPLVKDSIPHIVEALVWILRSKSGAVLRIAENAVVKLLSVVPSSILQHYVLDLSHPLMSLLSSHELEVSISCAVALNMILSKLSLKNEKKAWEMIKETKTIACIVTNIRNFFVDSMPIEYFQEMSSLLGIILWRWPPSRYSVWNDAVLMKFLGALLLKPDLQIKVAVLKLFSSLGLCGNGAKKLLENGEALLQTMVYCMGSSHALSVRMEGFRLAQCLATDEQGCLRMTSFCCVPFVKAIVCGMNRRSFHCGKISNDQMSLLVEACRLASITRWAGQHHISFWKHGIDKVLVDLLLEDFQVKRSQHLSSLEEQISLVKEGLGANFLLALRPYVWDTLGWLATHCDDDFNCENELHMNIVITCACVAFVDAIRKGRQICENDVIHASRSESASRAVLMMIYSPCKYIASKSRVILSKVLKPNGKEYLKQLLHFLNYTSSRVNIGLPCILQTIINLVGLTCYLGMSQYQRQVIGGEVMKTLLTCVRWCWSNPVHIKRHSIAPHSYNKFLGKTCCWISEEWEGENVLLLYGLWALAELVHHFCSVSSDEVHCKEAEIFSILQEVCNNTTAHGPRWFAAYILSHFGFYGFPNKIGKRIGKALNMEEYADMQLILASGESLSVHGVVLAIRCPSLLPPDNDKTSNNSSVGSDEERLSRNFQKTVRFSAHVDSQALLRLLDFVYFGYMESGEELVKKLKPLAKSCNLQLLLQLLYRKHPKWGTPIPRSDLALALGLVGHHFSDIILEAKATELSWTCSVCSLSVPHKHVHKVILWSSCDYLRALFESGMQESHSQTITVPVSWEAVVKLVEWFYTNQLPDPPYGCSWDNMDNEEKLHELHPYIELCWLAELWLLEDIQDACFKVVVSCLDSATELSIKVIQITAKFSLWKLAEFAAACMAPLYCNLRDSGDLEELDEFLVDMVRAASVRHSQGG